MTSTNLQEDVNGNHETVVYFDGSILHFNKNEFNNYMIISIEGKVVEKGMTSESGIIDIRHLPCGFYIFNLMAPDKVVSKKIIKN